MGQAAFMSSGIKAYCEPIVAGEAAVPPVDDSQARHVTVMSQVVDLLSRSALVLSQVQLEQLWNILGGKGKPVPVVSNEVAMSLRAEITKLIKGWWNYTLNARMLTELNTVLQGGKAPEVPVKREEPASPDLPWAKENAERLKVVLAKARDLCNEVESMTASEHQTSITIMTSAAASKIQDYVYNVGS